MGPAAGFIEPRLRSLRVALLSGRRWVDEIKFDSYRVQAHLAEGRVRLFTRKGYRAPLASPAEEAARR
jgi:bifunctional non-homologous end joining protein LigD